MTILRRTLLGVRWITMSSVRNVRMVRLFEGSEHAEVYAKFRPTYPRDVYETIASWGTGERNLAVDVACGSGQSTAPLKGFYKNVMGVDVSEAQITQATKTEGVTYRHGPAEDLSFLQDGSVDALTCAQGAHWLDLALFYKEADRVLNKGGVLCLYGYGNVVLHSTEAQDLVTHFYEKTLDGCWSSERRHIDNCYKDFQLPYSNSERNEKININFTGRLDDFIGYLRSWSGYVKYMKEKPGDPAMENLTESLQTLLQQNKKDENPMVSLHWPVFMLIGRKPS